MFIDHRSPHLPSFTSYVLRVDPRPGADPSGSIRPRLTHEDHGIWPCRSESFPTFARVIGQLIIWKCRASYNVRCHKKLLFLGQRLNINRPRYASSPVAFIWKPTRFKNKVLLADVALLGQEYR